VHFVHFVWVCHHLRYSCVSTLDFPRLLLPIWKRSNNGALSWTGYGLPTDRKDESIWDIHLCYSGRLVSENGNEWPCQQNAWSSMIRNCCGMQGMSHILMGLLYTSISGWTNIATKSVFRFHRAHECKFKKSKTSNGNVILIESTINRQRLIPFQKTYHEVIKIPIRVELSERTYGFTDTRSCGEDWEVVEDGQ